MSSTDYLISAVLVALVFIQIRERVMDLRSLTLPVVAVAVAGAYYRKSVPTSGHDVALDLILAVVGGLIGGACALTTRVWRRADGHVVTKAGVAAAILWVLGVGARTAFSYAASHGSGPAITRFSERHQITGTNAWVAALVIMALVEVVARLAVLRYRGYQLRHAVETAAMA
jgi:hypothetical protein